MIDIEDFPRHLNTIRHKQWSRLFDLLPLIEIAEAFGEVDGGQFDGSALTAPYWNSAAIVDQTVEVIFELNIYPIFDWPDWKEGRSLLANKVSDYSGLNTITLCKLLTTILRADRFNQGFLVSCFENGTMTRIIKGLQTNIEAQL